MVSHATITCSHISILTGGNHARHQELLSVHTLQSLKWLINLVLAWSASNFLMSRFKPHSSLQHSTTLLSIKHLSTESNMRGSLDQHLLIAIEHMKEFCDWFTLLRPRPHHAQTCMTRPTIQMAHLWSHCLTPPPSVIAMAHSSICDHTASHLLHLRSYRLTCRQGLPLFQAGIGELP